MRAKWAAGVINFGLLAYAYLSARVVAQISTTSLFFSLPARAKNGSSIKACVDSLNVLWEEAKAMRILQSSDKFRERFLCKILLFLYFNSELFIGERGSKSGDKSGENYIQSAELSQIGILFSEIKKFQLLFQVEY